MKKLITVTLSLSLILGAIAMLTACGNRVTYENSESYSVGPLWAEDEVKAIEIYWEGREVSVFGAFSDMISLKEDYTQKDEKALRYLFEDGILKVYPCASGERLGDLSKTLFVEIPYTQAYALDYVKIVATEDTNVDIKLLKPKTLDVTTEDGDITFDGILLDGKFKTEEGDLTVTSIGCDSFDFASETGNANLYFHLQGFTAIMRENKGHFTTTYDTHQNGSIYTYGTQEKILMFLTEGYVSLSDTSITK